MANNSTSNIQQALAANPKQVDTDPNANQASSASAITMSASENKLDDFDLSTYNIKLFVAHTDNGIVPTGTRKIIAKTGASRNYIDELSFEQFFSLEKAQTSAIVTEMSFTIKEPLGANLLDNIYAAAIDLGIPNFTKVPFWMEISFAGRDPSTSAPLKGIGLSEPMLIPIMIINMDAEITNSGSVYRFQAVKYSDIAHSSEYGQLRDEFSEALPPSGQFTADKVMEMLANTMTKRAEKSAAASTNIENATSTHATTGDKYKIVFEGFEGDDLLIMPDNVAEDTTSDGMPYLVFDPNSSNITFNAGTSVVACIDAIMKHTKYLRKSLATESDEHEKDIYYVEVTTQINTKNYDYTREDYFREHIYTVKPRADASISTVVEPSRKNTSAERLAELYNKGRVVKKYDYIFSGNNQHIIKFDFKLNYAWYVPVARLNGTTNPATPKAGILQSHLDRSHPERGASPDAPTASPASVDQAGETYSDLAVKSNHYNWTRIPEITSEQDDPKILGNASRTRDVTFITSIFEQALANPTGDLMQIDLEIRGDPFWMNPFNVSPTQALLANPYQMYIQLNVFLPNEPGESGLVNTRQSGLVSGLFKVISVEHRFENGKFLQTILAVRDPKVKVV